MIHLLIAVGVLAYIGVGVVVFTVATEKLDLDVEDAAIASTFWPATIALSPVVLVGWMIVVAVATFHSGLVAWLNRPKAVKVAKVKLPKATARKAS